MKNSILFLLVLLFVVPPLTSWAQDKESAKAKIEDLQTTKASITNVEREALKIKIELINEQFENGLITQEVADQQKKEAAELHAANIEDRLVILDKQIDLIQRNNNLTYEFIKDNGRPIQFGFGHKDANGERLFGLRYKRKKPKPFKYDKRTYSDFVISAGNNSLIGKGSYYDVSFLSNEMYFELGWAWRYRLNKDNNALRLQYGISIQTNKFVRVKPLVEPDYSNFKIIDNDGSFITGTKEDYVISETILRTSSLLFPIHLEMGPSNFRKTKSSIRYSIKNKFRFGIGGYLGVNLGLNQQVKPTLLLSSGISNELYVSSDLRKGLEEDRFVYGISTYIGAGSFLFYTKLDLSTLYVFEGNKYKIATVGLRIDM